MMEVKMYFLGKCLQADLIHLSETMTQYFHYQFNDFIYFASFCQSKHLQIDSYLLFSLELK